MAWEWSHTDEAYENVRQNLIDLPDVKLAEIEAEWRAAVEPEESWQEWGFDSERFDIEQEKVLAGLADERLSAEYLALDIYDRAHAQATCDNGGFNAWVCPFGCHTVPFDRDESEED